LDLGDKRRSARLAKMINNVVAYHSSSIPQQNEGWDTKASYHFLCKRLWAKITLLIGK
jgi:hypothetical protein